MALEQTPTSRSSKAPKLRPRGRGPPEGPAAALEWQLLGFCEMPINRPDHLHVSILSSRKNNHPHIHALGIAKLRVKR